MAKWLCGSMENFNSYGVDTGTLSEIDTTSGGLFLSPEIFGVIGYSVEFVGLKFNENIYSNTRFILDRPLLGRYAWWINANLTTYAIDGLTISNLPHSATTYKQHICTATAERRLNSIFQSTNGGNARCRSRGIIIRDASNNIVWQWLTSPSDFKSTPPSATVVGTLGWYYQGVDRHDETKEALLAYLNSITLTENLIIYDLDTAIPYGYFPATKDGFTITMENSLPAPSTGGGTLGVPKCRLMCSVGV